MVSAAESLESSESWTIPIVMKDANESSEELLLRIARGDQHAFAIFYDKHAGIVFALCSRILTDAREAEDVVQEVFVQVWQQAAKFNRMLGSAATWVITLGRNRAIDRLRVRNRRVELLNLHQPELSGGNRPQSCSIETDERADRVRLVLKQIPDEQRQAIELAFFGGMTQQEICESLAIPLGTVKARIRRGMVKLREQFPDLKDEARG
jgi:RNA polymerase sigma-70 factor (ECF subfamily)